MDRIRLNRLKNDDLNLNESSNLPKTAINHQEQALWLERQPNAYVRFKDKYRIKCNLSAGAHGIILWATDRTFTGANDEIGEERSTELKQEDQTKQYAVKRIFIPNRMLPLKLIREIKSLQFLRGHLNIINLLDVCPSGSSVNLVFPLMPINLTTVIYDGHWLSCENKNHHQTTCLYFNMLLLSLRHLHLNGIVHRDLKPSNILIDWNGQLKLADFGQARAIDVSDDDVDDGDHHQQQLSNDVCTRWYRAPELLWGSTCYAYEVDIWSAGCILAEMIQHRPLFKGDTDIEQLSLVVRMLGNPESSEWTEKLPDFNKIQFVHHSLSSQTKLLDQFSAEENVQDLLSKMIRYTDRWTSEQLLEHHYFQNCPNFEQALESDDLIKPKFVKHLAGPPLPPGPSTVVNNIDRKRPLVIG